MIKYCSNNDTLDPELQKWFTDECNSINASVVVAFIKDDDIRILKRACYLFIAALVCSVANFLFVLLSVLTSLGGV